MNLIQNHTPRIGFAGRVFPQRTEDPVHAEQKALLRRLVEDNADPCSTRFGCLSPDEVGVLMTLSSYRPLPPSANRLPNPGEPSPLPWGC